MNNKSKSGIEIGRADNAEILFAALRFIFLVPPSTAMSHSPGEIVWKEGEPGHSSSSRSILLHHFDQLCLSYGDDDAIILGDAELQRTAPVAVGFSELQYASQALAAQLYHRYRCPTMVLLDLRNSVAAEAVAVLACLRLGAPFVPVSVEELHEGVRLRTIVETLRTTTGDINNTPDRHVNLVAVVRCDNDGDPILQSFAAANVHKVVFVNAFGDLLEPMTVPDSLPQEYTETDDNMYILFTSGTSGNAPKAVIGSQKSTWHRLNWFHKRFASKENANNRVVIARRSKLTFVDGVNELLAGLLFPATVLYALNPDDLANRGVRSILDTPCTRATMLPTQLVALLETLRVESRMEPKLLHSKQHSLDIIVISGEPCPASLPSLFRKVFSTSKLINLYGQTETTGDVLCAVLTEMEDSVAVVNDNVVAVGYPIPGASVSQNSSTGELLVEGQNCLSNGYLRDSSTTFNSFATGDIGFCCDECWYVRGRLDDVGKINGIWTAPTEAEATFERVYGVSLCAAAIVDHALYLLLESNLISFSRGDMRKAGIPWHLIPKRIFSVDQIPRSGGAGKINRCGVKRLLSHLLSEGKEIFDPPQDALLAIASEILGIPVNDGSSFIDCGGDSALAVSFVNHLRTKGICSNCNISGLDVLRSETIGKLRSLIEGEPVRKKFRLQRTFIHTSCAFSIQPILKFCESHWAVKFRACVDAMPLVHKGWIYGACQGGIMQRVDVRMQKVDAVYDLGFRIQADLVLDEMHNTILVCGYQCDAVLGETSIVAALHLDLSSVKWKVDMSGTIKSTPILVDEKLYVSAGKSLNVLSVADRKLVGHVPLPSSTESRPVVYRKDGVISVVYAFSEWDVGPVILLHNGKSVHTIPDVVCPTYADLLLHENGNVLLTDILGSLHAIDMDTMTVESYRISSKPIFSGPVQGVDGCVIFGCHDGYVRCLKISDLSRETWTFATNAVVYCRPLICRDGTIIVATTAGDVIRLSGGGHEVGRTRVEGEIWSDPVQIDSRRIAFGARDSRMHILLLDSLTKATKK